MRHAPGGLSERRFTETHQSFLRARGSATGWRGAMVVAAIRPQLPGGRVGQLRLQNAVEAGPAGGVPDRSRYFHSTTPVPRPPVGPPDVVVPRAAVCERECASVPEAAPEPPHHAHAP